MEWYGLVAHYTFVWNSYLYDHPYRFYSEKDDAVLSKTETEIIQEEYEKTTKREKSR